MRVKVTCQAYYVHTVILITSIAEHYGRVMIAIILQEVLNCMRTKLDDPVYRKVTASRYGIDSLEIKYIIQLTDMKRIAGSRPNRSVDTKSEALRQQGSLHPNPEHVHDEAFRRDEFFDPRDLVQVRYEMLRRHQIDGDAVTEVASVFGVSRQAYYMTEAAFEARGIAGLMPRRRGPQRAHKCTDEILDFVER